MSGEVRRYLRSLLDRHVRATVVLPPDRAISPDTRVGVFADGWRPMLTPYGPRRSDLFLYDGGER